MTTRDAKIKVLLPGPLRECCGGAPQIEVPAGNVRAVLDELERDHPALHRSICDDTGAVRRHINLFVNTRHIRELDGLDTTLSPGDEVIILPAVSGG